MRAIQSMTIVQNLITPKVDIGQRFIFGNSEFLVLDVGASTTLDDFRISYSITLSKSSHATGRL